MNSYKNLILDIQDLGYEASYLNNTIEVKADELNDECLAMLWLDDSTIMADMGETSIPLCDLTDWNRKEVLMNFLEDPWNHGDDITEYDLPA